MFEVRLHRKVAKFLEELEKHVQIQCREAIDKLAENPFVNRPKCDIKKLSGKRDVYRLRVGDCRFVYVVDWKIILMEALRSE